ncbi:general transcription factor 3C polypeptide 2 isoform X2 [Chelonus insularis]|nr:general transcription factor 3C polypeptide 2-like isoform X2 [Chelonus insularis]
MAQQTNSSENINSNEVALHSNDKTNKVIKRRRGRPRKVIVENPLTMSKVENADLTLQNVTKEEIPPCENSSTENIDTTANISLSSGELTEEETNQTNVKRRRRRKGRGRRPGRKLIEPDNEYTPRLSLRPTEFHKEYTTIEIEFINEEVVCGRCKKNVVKKQWRKHNLDKHNNTAWIEGNEPINYEDNEKLWRSVLTKAHKQKRGVLFCDKCNTTKRSVLGFISHYKFCGKSEEEKESMMWTCPICHSVFMPSSQDFHERTHRDVERSKKVINSVKVDDYDGKRKRKAAEKAASKIIEFVEHEDVKPPAKKAKKNNIDSFIDKPKLMKSIPHVWKGYWIQALAANEKALCRQPGCTFAGSTLQEICNHHGQCNFTPRKTYICKICKFESELIENLKHHIENDHREKLVSDDEFDFNQSQSEESDNDPFNDEPNIPRSAGKQKQYDKFLNSDNRADFLKKTKFYKDNNLNIPYTPAIKWTLDFYIKNYRLILFENLHLNAFHLLMNSEAEKYLPKVKKSMRTKRAKDLSNNLKKTTEDLNEWKTWNQFESSVTDNIPTFFVGGPVWSMAWLPIPLTMYSNDIDQYLAISTHPSMNSIHVVGKSYKYNNIIQIWNLGHLTQAHSCTPVAPKLSYALAHKKGTIWCMEWCPSGAYGHFNLINNKKSENLFQRMGLLAVASSDGCVHIYSLPFPEVLNFNTIKDHDLPIYKTEPVITLHVNKYLHDKNKVNWQCLRVSWSKLVDHDIIAAGFSNGYVALWNIINNSPLLVTKKGDTLHINAYKHFYAHGQAVTYVEIIPIKGKRYLATASLDRCTKFWDLEDTSYAFEVVKKGVVVNGAWLMHWPNVYTAHDDVLGLTHTRTYMIGLREACSKTFPLLPTNSVTYGLAVSDFANGICHGTLSGEIAAIFPFQMLYFKDLDRLTRKRWLVSSIEVVDLETSQEKKKTANDVEKENKSKASLKDHNYMPETYEECANQFGIIFHDDLNNMKNKGTKKSVRRSSLNSDAMKFSPIEQYQFTSVNRIAWNPNAWSYLWIAAGYQNGLIRVLHLRPYSSQNSGTKLLAEYSKQMINKENNLQCSSAS